MQADTEQAIEIVAQTEITSEKRNDEILEELIKE